MFRVINANASRHSWVAVEITAVLAFYFYRRGSVQPLCDLAAATSLHRGGLIAGCYYALNSRTEYQPRDRGGLAPRAV